LKDLSALERWNKKGYPMSATQMRRNF
jgi:hypothetical protein